MAVVPKIKYLTNKDLLEEIHRSKNTYCEFLENKHTSYDFIVSDITHVTTQRIDDARQKRVDVYIATERKSQIAAGNKSPVINYSLDDVQRKDIVIRVMTFDHIPINEEKLAKAKNEADRHLKCNFPPFQHFVYDDEQFICVGKSHWQGGLHNGNFSNSHGKMSNKLALMFMKLVERYGHRGNWRGYTYIDEMKSQALLQLSQIGLQFDESRSDTPNPFAYYTAAITNSFTRVLNIEKRNQNIRDDILMMNGATPSYTRQTEQDMQRMARQHAEDMAKQAKAAESAPSDDNE
jgi:hypothetical protein